MVTRRRGNAPATKRALERVAAGEPPYRAALTEGISPSTVYRARARERRQHPGIYWDAERRADEIYFGEGEEPNDGEL